MARQPGLAAWGWNEMFSQTQGFNSNEAPGNSDTFLANENDMFNQ